MGVKFLQMGIFAEDRDINDRIKRFKAMARQAI